MPSASLTQSDRWARGAPSRAAPARQPWCWVDWRAYCRIYLRDQWHQSTYPVRSWRPQEELEHTYDLVASISRSQTVLLFHLNCDFRWLYTKRRVRQAPQLNLKWLRGCALLAPHLKLICIQTASSVVRIPAASSFSFEREPRCLQHLRWRRTVRGRNTCSFCLSISSLAQTDRVIFIHQFSFLR